MIQLVIGVFFQNSPPFFKIDLAEPIFDLLKVRKALEMPNLLAYKRVRARILMTYPFRRAEVMIPYPTYPPFFHNFLFVSVAEV